MNVAGIHYHRDYGQLLRLETSHPDGYFIGTYGEMPTCGRVAYLGNLPEVALADAWDGRLAELRHYLQPDTSGLGRIAVDASCTVLLENTRHGRLLVNPETFSELPVDTSFWERDESGLYLRGQAI